MIKNARMEPEDNLNSLRIEKKASILSEDEKDEIKRKREILRISEGEKFKESDIYK